MAGRRVIFGSAAVSILYFNRNPARTRASRSTSCFSPLERICRSVAVFTASTNKTSGPGPFDRTDHLKPCALASPLWVPRVKLLQAGVPLERLIAWLSTVLRAVAAGMPNQPQQPVRDFTKFASIAGLALRNPRKPRIANGCDTVTGPVRQARSCREPSHSADTTNIRGRYTTGHACVSCIVSRLVKEP